MFFSCSSSSSDKSKRTILSTPESLNWLASSTALIGASRPSGDFTAMPSLIYIVDIIDF